MFEIKAHIPKQQLNILIQNVYDDEDLKTILFIINREVIKLSPGWTAVLDLRNMKVLEQRLTKYIKKMHRVFLQNDVQRIATLFDNMILKMQFKRLSKEIGSDKIAFQFLNENEWRKVFTESAEN